MRGLLQPLTFLALAGVPFPCLPVNFGGGGALLGLTVLFLWLGGLLFLIYTPPSRALTTEAHGGQGDSGLHTQLPYRTRIWAII